MPSEYAAIALRCASAAAAREDRARITRATTTAAIRSNKIHGHKGVPELSPDAPELAAAGGVVVVGVDVTVVVCVLVFVAVEVCVDVWVDVSVDVCVFVDVSVVVDVVWLDDVRVGNVRVALGVGPSDGAEVAGGVGTEIVRDTFGRLLPPPHATRTTARTAAPTINRTMPRCITFDPPSFVSRSPTGTVLKRVTHCE